MSEITRVGVDLAKNVIQVHAVDAVGKVVTNKALQRDKFILWCAMLPARCLIAMEASSSAHHWARKLVALGQDAHIIAAHLVEPYRLQGKSGKNDANDAADRPKPRCVKLELPIWAKIRPFWRPAMRCTCKRERRTQRAGQVTNATGRPSVRSL